MIPLAKLEFRGACGDGFISRKTTKQLSSLDKEEQPYESEMLNSQEINIERNYHFWQKGCWFDYYYHRDICRGNYDSDTPVLFTFRELLPEGPFILKVWSSKQAQTGPCLN